MTNLDLINSIRDHELTNYGNNYYYSLDELFNATREDLLSIKRYLDYVLRNDLHLTTFEEEL